MMTKSNTAFLTDEQLSLDRRRVLTPADISEHPASSTNDRFSVIVVSFNTREYTLACLRSLAVHEPHAQVIVVDNASTDDSAAAIAEEFPNLKLLCLSQNIGFGRANTVGLEVAEHDVIVLFNSDAEVTDQSLTRCVQRLSEQPQLGAVTPRLRGADGVEQNSRHAVPVFSNTLRRALWGRPMEADDREFWIPGTCMILKRQAIADAGGLFHPSLFMYWEDADLCSRLKSNGFQLAVVNDAEILHHGGASGGGPDCTGKPGLHAWYTFGRHMWFAAHRPKWEAPCLWLLEFVDAFRCMGRAIVRSDRRYEFRYGRTLLSTLLRYAVGASPVFAISDTHGRRDSELLISNSETNHPANTSTGVNDVGAVVIGRNEGIRLRRCLNSLSGQGVPVVYVDSGSTDGSLELARYLNVNVVQLDMSSPFTAARARNVGMRELQSLYPELKYIQFVDGDCEICDDWLNTARTILQDNPDCAVVCGTLQEKQPQVSIYNRLCQLEWRRPQGNIESSGGIFMGSIEALESVAGFDDSLIAGEEPEMCLRLRRKGHKIYGSRRLMARHDAAMNRFGQWWKRSVRAGYSYAEAFAMHGRSDGFRRKEVRSILVWGLIMPLLTLLTAWPTMGLSLVFLAAAYIRLYRSIRAGKLSSGERPEDAAIYARFVVLGKFAQAQGLLKYWLNRAFRRRSGVIEYK